MVRAKQPWEEALIRQGVEGGKKAAYALRSAILEQCGDFAGNMEVIAKVYANLGGLAKAMRRNGCLEAEETLKEFTIGFTQGKATFDFVDVGHGKERADNKIKGRLLPSVPAAYLIDTNRSRNGEMEFAQL